MVDTRPLFRGTRLDPYMIKGEKENFPLHNNTSVKNIKNVWRCRDNRTAKSMKTSRDDGIKQFSIQHHLTYLST